MRILITNDDGIDAAGIRKLAEVVTQIADEVYIVAPDGNRSAISHGISIRKPLKVRMVDFPVPVTAAYSCSGTPADCVKVAVNAVLSERPDFVLSGMNHGFNLGYDTVYSGTVAAARDAIYQGIPAVAVSAGSPDFSIADRYLPEVLKKIFSTELVRHELWNINLPACTVEECKGVRFGTPAAFSYFKDTYFVKELGNGEWEYTLTDEETMLHEENSDFQAVRDGYISVGTLECGPLKEEKVIREFEAVDFKDSKSSLSDRIDYHDQGL